MLGKEEENSYFTTPKHLSLNAAHYFIRKVLNNRDLQHIAFARYLI